MNWWADFARTVAFVICYSFVVVASAAEKRLTTDGRLKSDPVFTDRTGAEVVFTVEESPMQLRLMRMKLADSTQTPVHKEETRSEFEASFSADGKLFAHVQNRGNLSLAIAIHDLAKATNADIKPGGGFSGPRGPAISPDGSTLLYCFADKQGQQIISANALGQNPKVVIDTPGISSAPHFAPDGQRFVFSSTRDGNLEIYAADLAGQDVRRLTDQPKQDMRPRFSPDGQRLAFTSARDGNYELYVMRADGTEVQRLTTNPERDDYAAWHPNGKELLIVSERQGRHDLYSIPVPLESK